MSLGTVLFFFVTLSIDSLDARHVIHLPEWLNNGGIDDARAILSAEMGSVSTVLALIFSVSLLVLSMVATLFGPRLIYRFIQDWTTQGTIGLFLSSFIFILLAFVVTRADERVIFIPQLTLLSASALVFISFGFLVYYSHRVASSIQNPDMVSRIVDDLERSINSLKLTVFDLPADSGLAESELHNYRANGRKIAASERGFVQYVDHKQLIEMAAASNAILLLLFRPGQYVHKGEAQFAVYPPEAQVSEAELRKHVHIGPHRILWQDVEFGLYQIVEIGIRALSPAVNDTFTGVACVDCVTDALGIILEELPSEDCWYDKDHLLRLIVPPLRFNRLVKVGFDQIRQAAVDTPAVQIRILDSIARLAPKLHRDEHKQALLEQANAIYASAHSESSRTALLDKADIERMWKRAQSALTVKEPS